MRDNARLRQAADGAGTPGDSTTGACPMSPRELISGRVGAIAGLVFVVLLFLSTAMLNAPDKATDAELVAWWSEDGNLTTVLVSTYLQIGAALCFLVFITALRAVSLRAEGGAASLTTLAFAAGVTFVALLLASDGPRGVTAVAVKLNGEALPAADLLRYLPQFGYIIAGTIGGAAVGAAILANSVLVLRTGALGRWLGILGLVCAAGTIALALVVGPFFIPVLLVWVIATSLALWRVPEGAKVHSVHGQEVEAALAR